MTALHLIPEPQYAQVGGAQVAGIAAWAVELKAPAPDRRLTALARSIFGRVAEPADGAGTIPASSSPSSVTTASTRGDAGEEASADRRPHSCQADRLDEEASGVYAVVSPGLSVNVQLARRVLGRADGYVLALDVGRIEIYAWSASGLFYGMKTLEQLLRSGGGAAPAVTIADWADLRLRSDYLDLRTVYPTFEHIVQYVEELARYKINTLIVEYEDKLPFRKLPFLRHPDLALTPEQHERLLETAHANFVEIIPKQQSFGHLEYILKHPAYIGLRETPDSVGELCPHRAGSYEMMAEIIEDIADLHPHSRYLHIGCDEVWSLGTCAECRGSGASREASFIGFVNRLADKVVALGKTPMIWHDMLMQATEEEIAQLDKRVIVVIWIYGGHRMKADARRMIRTLRSVGVAVLGASSVRCWDDNGEQNYPVIRNRIDNIVNWVNLAQSEQLGGIINTNWSAPFALGSPYGLFETSRYPAFFAADLNWNFRARVDTYLIRFLQQYHGVRTADLDEAEMKDYGAADYYALMPQLLPVIRDNRLTAELIDAMIRYETPFQRRFPLHTFLFRGELSPDSEEVITCLKDKHRANYADLEAARAVMQSVVDRLLPPQMAELFMTSRFYRPALYEARLNQILSKSVLSDNKEAHRNA